MDLSAVWEILSGYPTNVYTILIGVLLIFWLFAILGAIDIDIFQFDTDVDLDVDAGADVDGEVPGFLGLLHTLGFTGVPITIVLTVLVFLSWVMTYFASAYLLPLVPTTLFKMLAGTGVLVGSFIISVPITSKIVAPLRKLAQFNSAKSNKDFLGSVCIVTSQTVDDTFGQGEIQDKGAGLIVSIRAEVPNGIKKGDIVRPISYDKDKNLYHVITEKEFEQDIDRLNGKY